MNKYQKGFSPVVIALMALVLSGIGGAGYYLINKQPRSLNNQNQQLSTVPSITIISPKQGESLETGKTYDIVWSSQNVEKVSFYLKKQGETDVALTMGNNTQASLGKYSWIIPTDNDDINLGGQFRIGIFADDNNSPITYSDWFSIISSATSRDWKTYNNQNYGFEIKYPLNLKTTVLNPLSDSIFRVIFTNKNCSVECASIDINIKNKNNKSFQDIKKEAEKTWSFLLSKEVSLKETAINGIQAYINPSYEFNLGGITIVGENYIYEIRRSYSDKDISEQLFDQILSTFQFTK